MIVEGPSDQFYLSTLAQSLIAQGELSPPRELVFAPSGGIRGVKSLAGLLTAREGTVPPVLLDSDGPGREFASKLRSGLYSGSGSKVLEVGNIVGVEGAEIEDLLPPSTVAAEFDKLYAAALGEHSALDELDTHKPIRPQLECAAKNAKLSLEGGWTVELARRVCRRLRKKPSALVISPRADAVATLFSKLQASLE